MGRPTDADSMAVETGHGLCYIHKQKQKSGDAFRAHSIDILDTPQILCSLCPEKIPQSNWPVDPVVPGGGEFSCVDPNTTSLGLLYSFITSLSVITSYLQLIDFPLVLFTNNVVAIILAQGKVPNCATKCTKLSPTVISTALAPST